MQNTIFKSLKKDVEDKKIDSKDRAVQWADQFIKDIEERIKELKSKKSETKGELGNYKQKADKSFMFALILGIINVALGGINISNIAAGELQNILVIIFGIIISLVAATTAGFTTLSNKATSKAEHFEQSLKPIEDRILKMRILDTKVDYFKVFYIAAANLNDIKNRCEELIVEYKTTLTEVIDFLEGE